MQITQKWYTWLTCISKHHTFWRGPARRKWTPRGLFFWTTTYGSTKKMLLTNWYCRIVIFLQNVEITSMYGGISDAIVLPFQVRYHLRWQNIAWWNWEENIQFNWLKNRHDLKLTNRDGKVKMKENPHLTVEYAGWSCKGLGKVCQDDRTGEILAQQNYFILG
jgi:hypothetical protein